MNGLSSSSGRKGRSRAQERRSPIDETTSVAFGPRTPRDRATLRFVATPQDANVSGEYVAAGSILEWIDKAGYVCAVGWSSTYCVTAYVGNVHFTRPVRPGHLMEATAQIVHTGRTSMQVLVRLTSTDIRHDDPQQAMHCLLVFVAVDAAGHPVTVPQWSPQNDADRTLHENAMQRVAVRQQIREEMQSATFSDNGSAPRVVLRQLALPRVANFGGKVHGGTVMRWINEAAYAVAVGWSSERAAAVYTGGIHFHRPIRIGHLVEIDARLMRTEAELMHISVHVRSTDPRRPDEPALATQCVAIFAERGEPQSHLKHLPLLTAEDRALDALAQRLQSMREALPRVPEGRRAPLAAPDPLPDGPS